MKRAARFISLFLILGGLLGFLGMYFLAVHAVRQHQDMRVIFTILAVVLFGWSISPREIRWQGKPRGVKCAKILFALQIPVFTVAQIHVRVLDVLQTSTQCWATRIATLAPIWIVEQY